MGIAEKLIEETRIQRPDLYQEILTKIRPHSLKSVLKVLDQHLQQVPDLRIFNLCRDKIPEFCWDVITHMKFPVPGDAIGINIICRVTKSDTQGALDSKHLRNCITHQNEFNVEKDILDELSIFSTHMQLFELANRHKYATVFMSQDVTIDDLMERLPWACVLERGCDYNKGRNAEGRYEYLASFRYIIVEDRGSVKVLYKSLAELSFLLRRVPIHYVVAFSDIRCVNRRCGNYPTFVNMVHLAERQLFMKDGSRYEKDVITLLRFMFSQSELLPMNREGLARNKDRTVFDVLSFEAMKRNSSKLATGIFRGMWYKTKGSSDHTVCGEQTTEGTGGSYELIGKFPVMADVYRPVEEKIPVESAIPDEE